MTQQWNNSGNEKKITSISGTVLKEAIVDLRKVDKNMTDTSLPKGLKKGSGYNNFNSNTWKTIDINSRMDYESKDYTLKHQSVWENKLEASDESGKYELAKIDSWVKFASNYYYRYQITSWFGIFVMLGCMSFLLFFLIKMCIRDRPKTITEDGKKYELTDVSYKINKKKTIEKVQTITTRSKDEYPKTLTETISGKEVTLKATGDVDWKEVRSEGVIRTQEYKRQRDIPKTIKSTRTDADGNQMDITLELTDTENASRTEKFSAPAKFYSPSPDGKLYMLSLIHI